MYFRRRRPRWPLALSRLLYWMLLFLYPAPFRREFGGEMAQVFGDLSVDAYRRRGVKGLAAVWLDTLRDLTLSGLREHLERAHRPHPRHRLAAAGAGTPAREPRRWAVQDRDRYDKFTERARQVLNLAQEESRRFNHNYIGTEHLLLALVREGDGIAAKVLSNLGVSLDDARARVEQFIGRGDRIVLGEVGLTPRAKKVLELAVDESRRLGHHYIGTEHLLLGLVREGEGIAATVLESLGVNLERVRAQTIQVLGHTSASAAGAAGALPPQEPQPGARGQQFQTGGSSPRFTRRARQVLSLAQEESQRFNHNYIGTEHLLLGLVSEGDGYGAQVLQRLGVELAKVRNAVEFIIERGDRIVLGEIGLTPRSKKVIELAVDEAARLNAQYLGTEHLLLGLVREGEGIAAGVLESLGVRLERVRVETIRLLQERGWRNEDEATGGERERGASTAESSEIWTGKAGSYDRTRPTPPLALLDLLRQLIGTPHPALVVDLGSGTGLSTAVWAERAQHVIGIEPNADMRQEAARKIAGHPYAARIEYQEGTAQQTGLPDGCADIVTVAQAFHWMEPTATLAEVARILRPGGLFAAYDYDAPPAIRWELDRVAQEVTLRFVELARERGLAQSLKIWPKNKSLDPLRESSHFRFTREVMLHSVERGDAARYVEMMRSNALSAQFEFTDEEVGFDRLTQAASQYIGSEQIPWYFSYRVRIGIK